MTNPFSQFWMAIGLASVLVACGGDDWEPIEGATVISEAELDELASSGELIDYSPPDPDEVRRETERQLREAEAVIEDYLVDHPLEAPLFDYDYDRTRGVRQPDGTIRLELDGGRQVILHGEAQTRLSDAAAIRAWRDPANQRALLELLLEGAPSTCDGVVPGAGLLDGMSAQELDSINRELAACISDVSSVTQPFGNDTLDEPLLSEGGFTPTTTQFCGDDYDQVLGGGNDALGSCDRAPTNPLAANFRWLDHVSPVKDQARRGSCVAFGATGALEYAYDRRQGFSLDLSEQHLYSMAVLDYHQRHIGDGVDTTGFLGWLAATQRSIAPEQDWGYNPAVCAKS